MPLRITPVTVSRALRYIEETHSHHHAPPGGLFAVGVSEGERLVCVALASRPVARKLDQRGGVCEVTRVASDGTTKHAASACIAAITRAAIALGYDRVISYTLLGEAGTSYLAAGWRITGLTANAHGWQTRKGRSVNRQTGGKARWEFGPQALECDGAAALVYSLCIGRVIVPTRAECDAASEGVDR